MIVQSVSCQEGELYCIDDYDHMMMLIIIIIHWTNYLSQWSSIVVSILLYALLSNQSIHVFNYPSTHPSIYPLYLFHQFIDLIYLSIYLFHLSIYPSYPSIHLSSIYPSIYVSISSIYLYNRFAGQVGWVVSIGPDTLKSTMQTTNHRISLNDAFRTIYRQYGELSYHIYLSINHIYLCIYLWWVW
jgi:hypothetical protein